MTLPAEQILIVDDEAIVLAAISHLLKHEGYEVLTAQNGEEALKILKEKKIDLILCDNQMPGIEGIEVLRQAFDLNPLSVRLLFSAHTDEETVIKAINIGHVNHFITKPWDNEQLCQTIRVYLQKSALEKEMQAMQELIIEHHKELAKAHKSLKGQLEMGAKIHETLLLGQIPKNIAGVSIQALTVPSHEVDGDFFEFYQPLTDVFDIVLGDVMGKGIPAALVATAVKTQLIRFAMPPSHPITFDHETWWHEDILKIDKILTHVHLSIVPELIKLEYFVSLIYARLDLKKRTLSFLDCGFTKPIHWHAEEKKATFLKGDNYPLGMMSDGIYKVKEVTFKENDIFVFYSDGVTEARSASGEFFDLDRLIEIIKNEAHSTADTLTLKIKEAVFAFHDKKSFDDDLSIIVIKIDFFVPIRNSQQGKVLFAADLTQLKAVRDLIGRAAHQAPGDHEKMAHDLKLAINEIFCNIVKHGYRGIEQGPILIQVEHDLTGIKIEISDQGFPFEPLCVTEPSLYGDKDDGYGWFIIRQLVEQVMYLPKQTDGGWNHLRIYKNYCTEEERMELIHSVQGDTLVITPLGESLDAKETPEFKERILEIIDESEVTHVIFDLKDLQFVDSSGLGCFLSILRKLNADGGDLKLSNMTKPVRSMFELVSMHKIFDIYNSPEEALQVLKASREL